MSCSRARSGAPTCPAGTRTRCSARSACWSTRCRQRRRSIPATWASPPWEPSGPPTRSWRSSRAEVKLKAPRGTFDVLPDDGAPRLRLLRLAQELLDSAGYGYFESPALEDTELFARGVGEATDIVQKEMFTF